MQAWPYENSNHQQGTGTEQPAQTPTASGSCWGPAVPGAHPLVSESLKERPRGPGEEAGATRAMGRGFRALREGLVQSHLCITRYRDGPYSNGLQGLPVHIATE